MLVMTPVVALGIKLVSGTAEGMNSISTLDIGLPICADFYISHLLVSICGVMAAQVAAVCLVVSWLVSMMVTRTSQVHHLNIHHISWRGCLEEVTCVLFGLASGLAPSMLHSKNTTSVSQLPETFLV